MKRTSKILILVLSLALVFAAVATVVSATAADLNVKKEIKFESAAPGLVGTASDGANPKADNFVFQQGNRAGKVEIVEGADGNKYALITQTDKVGTSGPYAYTSAGGNAAVTDGVLSLGDNDISNYKYYLFELDVMSPTGKFPQNAALDPHARAFKANATSRDFWNTNAHQNIVRFGNDNDGAYLFSDVYDEKLYVNPYEFTKISIVLENTTKEGDANIGLTSHIFVNGELWFSKVATNVPTNYHSNTPHAAFVEFRVNYTLEDDPTKTLAIDNYKYATVPAGSETAIADIVEYDKASMPLGLPVAQVGDVKFDNIDVALAAVADGETLKLLADVTTPFEVDKLIFIDTNGFKADARPADGYALQETEPGIYKVISSAGRTVEVFWDECLHEEPCEDNYDAMHPLAYFDELAIGEKFYAAYNPSYNGLIGDDGKYYQLVGWKNLATDEVIALDAAVTEADVEEGFVFLEPVFEITVKNFEYTSGGKLLDAFDGEKTLADVIKAADAGSTIKFCSDIKWANTAYIDIGKKLTIDLNGYTLIACREGSQAKTSLFRMTGGTDLTVTSSRFGGKIFNEGWNGKTSVGAAGVFNWPNDTAILRINGNIDGKPALSIYSGNVVQGYSQACEYHIDGGMFVTVVGDQQGLFDSRKAGRDASIVNAFFYNKGAGVVSYAGRNTETDQDHKVTMDNCVVIGHAVANIVKPAVLTMTNCYVTGNVNAIKSATYNKVTAGDTAGQLNVNGTVIIGDGNYFGGELNGDIQLADGVKLYDVPTKAELPYFTHEWKASADFTFDASSFVVTETTGIFNFNKLSTSKDVKPINVIWKNSAGDVIGESIALPGMEATAPANLKVAGTLVPGWLDYIPAEWNESLVIPEGVDEYVITAKEGGAVVPVAAVELYFNIRQNTHFEYRVYVPTLAEGIELTAISFRGTDRVGKYNDNYAKFTINGKEYSMVDGWPGLASGATDAVLEMTFTYGGVSYNVKKNIDIVDYVTYILDFEPAEGQLGYSEDAKKLAVNTANYLYNGLTIQGKSNDTLKAIVEEYADDIYTIADKDALVVPDLTAVKDYISSATLYVDTYSVYMQFNLTDAGKAADVKLSCGATAGSDTEYATLGYIYTNQTHIANLNNLYITITPAVAEGEEAAEPIVINFTLAEYYALLAANGAQANTLALVESMYGYAEADAYYRNLK